MSFFLRKPYNTLGKLGSTICLLLALTVVGCADDGSMTQCFNDSDCPLRGEVCRAEKCVKQKSCSKDADCVYKTDVCQGGLCTSGTGGTTGPKNCANSCTSDAQCSKCSDGRTSCLHGACMKSERAKSYERCGSSIGVACAAGLLCVGMGKSNYCFPECDSKQSRCDNNKGSCLNASGTSKGVCLPDGQAKEGKSCESDFSGEKVLDTSKLCVKGLHCNSKNICSKPITVGFYMKCQGGKTCEEKKATCVVMSRNATHGYCLPVCQPGASCQGGKGKCVKLQSGQGACLLNGTAKADSRCGPGGEKLTPESFCAAGFNCASFSSGSLCLKEVPQCSGSACPSGRVCVPGSSGGVCAIKCQGTACPSGLRCKHIHASGGHFDICVP